MDVVSFCTRTYRYADSLEVGLQELNLPEFKNAKEPVMFCSECGKEASGKFCWSCGRPLQQLGVPAVVDGNASENVPVLIDWSNLTDCRALLAIAEIRERIARHAAQCQKKFSGEEFLAYCDKFASVLTGGVPLSLIAKISQPLSERLGFKTGKLRRERLAERPGNVLVAVLCSLAQNGQQIRDIKQLSNGCVLQAALPSDIWSLKGDLLLTVLAEEGVTVVEAGTAIHGQVYDWGKSNRLLDRLFIELVQFAKAA
jgi:hypothetical protein